jgi:hypothetical protein
MFGEPDIKSGKTWTYRFYEPETMNAESMVVWFLLSGRIAFWDCKLTLEFNESGQLQYVRYQREQRGGRARSYYERGKPGIRTHDQSPWDLLQHGA